MYSPAYLPIVWFYGKLSCHVRWQLVGSWHLSLSDGLLCPGMGCPARRFYSPEDVSRSWQVKWWMVLSAYSCGQPSFCVISPDEKPRTWYETTSCSMVSSLLILFSSSGIEIEVNSSGLSFAGIISSLIRVVFLYRSVVCLTIKTKERGKLFPRNEKSVARAGCCRRFLRGYFMNTKYTAAMRHTKAAR